MKYEDYYAVLGVARDADADAIRLACRKLARKYHPDVSKAADAEARFKEVAQAYATLKDPQRRAAYDSLGTHQGGEEFSPPPQWQHDAGAAGEAFEAMDLADLLAALGRGPGRRRAAARPQPGADHETAVRITLEQAHRGATVHLEVVHEDGSRTLAVSIPAGVTDGQRLRLRGKGGRGRNGGPEGDIYLDIRLAPHPVFRPDGHDLWFDLQLAPWEAALGAEVQVPTLDGPVLLAVPPGTASGRKLRLRGRGLATGKGGRGDQYALVHIAVPASLGARERQLFEELARISHFDPRAIGNEEKTHASEPA